MRKDARAAGRSASDDRVRRALNLLLRLYPSSFQQTLGQDLVETALHRRREAVRRHPATGPSRFWLTEGVRFAFDGMLERVHGLRLLTSELGRAWRGFRRHPLQHAVAIATLAVGIGATVAVLNLADTVVFRPLPYADSRALFLIHARFGGTENSSNSLANLRDLQASVSTMSWLAGAADRSPALTDDGADPERISVLDVTEGYLPGLGARVHIGRPFVEADYRAGAPRVAIVSHALWQRRWGGRQSAVGASVWLNGVPYTMVGVMSPAFRDPEPIESGAVTGMWAPVSVDDYKDRDDFSFRVLGRVRHGATAALAAQELTQAGHRLAAAYPENRGELGEDLDFVLHPLHEMTVSGARRQILLLLGAVLLLLALACANVASLFLARGISRAPELAMRSALGATRARLALQLFGETLMTAVIAGGLGALLGGLSLRVFVTAAPGGPAGIPRLHELGLDLRTVVVVIGVTLLTALTFGILPALRGARAAGAGSSIGGRATTSAGTQRLQSTLVGVEVAISLVLVTAAVLLLTSVRHLLNVPPGFDATNVIVVDVRPPFTARSQESDVIFHGALLERAASIPGVARAALAHLAPGTRGGAWTRVTADNALPLTRVLDPGNAQAPGEAPGADFFAFNSVSNGFFELLQIPLRTGRLFQTDEGGPLEVILNESAVRRFFPGVERPLGRRLLVGTPNASGPFREVVGIVGDVRQQGPAREPEPQIYLPYQQRSVTRLSLLIEQTAGTIVTADAIRHMVREVAPDVPVDRIELLAARYAATSAETRVLASLLSAFAAIGLLLASIGTYATVSHAFSRRLREVAIRLALGADAANVFRLVLSRTLAVSAAGIAAGLVLSLLLSRFLEGQLHGVASHDPVVLTAAVLGITLAVVAAALGPGIRAAKIDPNTILKNE